MVFSMKTKDVLTVDDLYKPLSKEIATERMNKLQNMISGFLEKSTLDRDCIDCNDALLLKTILRIDQRSDYFIYFHSTVTPGGKVEIDEMSQYKQIALLCYWIIKYKPLRIIDMRKELAYYKFNHCTVNEAFAAFIFIGQINSAKCLSKEQKEYYMSQSYISDLFYKFMHHDISKEAMIFTMTSVVCNK